MTTDDIREGMTGVVSVFISDPQFQGQTKDRLNNPELAGVVDGLVRPSLEHWLNHNISVAEGIVARIILAARARAASRAAQQAVSRKSATSNRLHLPGKLSDCTSPGTAGSELFGVEGDSAGGSAKQGRNRIHQAILPLRGKVLNVENAPLTKVLENKELSDLVTALGCGLLLGVAALTLLFALVNPVTGWIAAAALVLYVLVYTPLKRTTPRARPPPRLPDSDREPSAVDMKCTV